MRASLELLQQLAVDVAFARLLGHQVPEVADLGLADAVDAAEPLLEAVRVPGQVVVHHQVRALEVDALAGGVGGQQDLHLGVVPERLLRLHPLLAAHAAVDHDHGLLAAEQRGDAALEIVQRVAVLGEETSFWCGEGFGRTGLPPVVIAGCSATRSAIGAGVKISPSRLASSRHFLSSPLRRTAGASASSRFRVSISSLQLGDRARRGRLIEDLLFGGLDLVVRRVFEILDVFSASSAERAARARTPTCAAALEQFQLAQAASRAAPGGGAATGRSPRATRRAGAEGS